MQRRERRSESQQSGEVLRLTGPRFIEGGHSLPIAAELRQQHTKIVVSQGRLRRESNHSPKTLFRLVVAAEFSGRETLEVIQRRIAGACRESGVDRCQRLRRLPTLQELESLVVGCGSLGGLRRGSADAWTDAGCQRNESDEAAEHTVGQAQNASCEMMPSPSWITTSRFAGTCSSASFAPPNQRTSRRASFAVPSPKCRRRSF